jgi:hypothetical protein
MAEAIGMKESPELWKRLRVGDRVRLVELPLDFFNWPRLHPETRQAYKILLKRRTPVAVYQIDEFGMPWVAFRSRRKNGRIRHDWLAVNHGGLAIVKPRKKTARK